MPRADQGWTLMCADWLDQARRLASASVDLVYVDPPFNTGAERRAPVAGGKRGRATAHAFGDRFESTAAYIAWMRERLDATRPALKPAASVLVHVDWRTSHRVRVLLDELFGEEGFVNHLVWSYGLGGSSPRRFARKHDDILFYTADPAQYWFEPPRVPATSRRLKGQDKKATDVLEVPALNNMAGERTGYPTQKPLALLTMLIGACCPPGGTVFDPCCGSGTSLVAAQSLGRRAVGGDVNPDAVALARRRLMGEVAPAR